MPPARSSLPCLLLALPLAAPAAQVQPNSADASLLVDGRSGDGYAGQPAASTFTFSELDLALAGGASEPWLLAVGVPQTVGVPLGGLGLLGLGLPNVILAGALDAQGQASASLALPANVQLGIDLALQAAVFAPSAGSFLLSAPQALRVALPDLLAVAAGDPTCSPQSELLGLALDGTAQRRFHTPHASCAVDVADAQWSPTGQHLAYRRIVNGTSRLHLAAAHGAPLQFLLGETDEWPSSVPFGFQWSPDGQWLLYSAPAGLTAIDLSGTDARLLFPAPPAGASFSGARWSADGAWVAFWTNLGGSGRVWVAELASGLSWPVHDDELAPFGTSFRWSPSGAQLALLHEPSSPTRAELSVYNPTSDALTLVSGPNFDDVVSYAWAPDASRLAFAAERFTDFSFELFTVRPDGTDERRLTTGSAGSQQDLTLDTGYAWSPLSNEIAFLGDLTTQGKHELYLQPAAPAPGAVPQTLSVPPSGGMGLARLAWSPDGQRLLYLRLQSSSSNWDLRTVRRDGSEPALIATGSGGWELLVTDQAWSPVPGDERLVYLADVLPGGQGELMLSSADGQTQTQLASALAFPSVSLAKQWLPDGSGLVLRAQDDDQLHLSTLVDGSTLPLHPAGVGVGDFELRP